MVYDLKTLSFHLHMFVLLTKVWEPQHLMVYGQLCQENWNKLFFSLVSTPSFSLLLVLSPYLIVSAVCNFFKKERLWHRCFPVNFIKSFRTAFSWNTSELLLLINFNCISCSKHFFTFYLNQNKVKKEVILWNMADFVLLYSTVRRNTLLWQIL